MNEVVVFENFFMVGLRMSPHPVFAEILQKFGVQLHQLMPNAIGKFIWVVNSCGGRPTTYVSGSCTPGTTGRRL
jgi:hypothetical protein